MAIGSSPIGVRPLGVVEGSGAAPTTNPVTLVGGFGPLGASAALGITNALAVGAAFGPLGATIHLLEADQLSLTGAFGPLGAAVGLGANDALTLVGAFGALAASINLGQAGTDALVVDGAFGALGASATLATVDPITVDAGLGPLGANVALLDVDQLTVDGGLGPLGASIGLAASDALSVVGGLGPLGAAIALSDLAPDKFTLVGAFGGLGALVAVQQQGTPQAAPAPGIAGPTVAPPTTSGALAIPPPSAPVVNTKTGTMTPVWQQYMLQLGGYAGAATTAAASAAATAAASDPNNAAWTGSALKFYIEKLVSDAQLGSVGVWDQAGVPSGPSEVGGSTTYYNIKLHTLFEWNGSRWVSNLQANAVAGSLEPGQLNVPDPTNLVGNSNWSDSRGFPSTSGWAAPGGGIPALTAVNVAGTAAVPTGAPSYNVGDMVGVAAQYGTLFAVVPGETYYFAMWVASAVAGLAPAWGLMLYSADRASSGFADGASGTLATAGQWQLLAGQVTIPTDVPGTTTGTAYGLLYLESGIVAQPGGPLWLGPMVARKAASAELLVPGSITNSFIADATITSAKIASVNANLLSGTVGTVNLPTLDTLALANGTLSAANVSGTLAAANIPALDALAAANGKLTGTNIVAASLTGTQIAAGTITGNNVVAGTITGSLIAAGTITAANITAGTITGNLIAANTITGNNLVANTISAGQIAAGAIGTAALAVGSPANVVWNPSCAVSTSGWVIFSSSGSTGVVLEQCTTSGYFDPSEGAGEISAATMGSGDWVDAAWGGVIGNFNKAVACEPSTWYEAQAKLTAYYCAAQVQLVFFDSSGTQLAVAGPASGVSNPPAGTVSGFGLSWVAAKSPSNAAYVSMVVQMFSPNTTWSGPFSVQWCQAQLGLTVANPSEVSPYAPGGATAIEGGMIVTESITALQIAAGTITGSKIAAGTIDASNIASGTITSNQLYSGTVQANLIQGNNVAANTLTVSNLAAGTLSASNITSGTIDAAVVRFTDAFVTNAYIQNLAVGNSKIAGNAVQAGNILQGAVSSPYFTLSALNATSCQVSVPVTSGQHVYIYAQVWGNVSGLAQWFLYRDTTTIWANPISSSATQEIFSNTYIENPSSGTYTYKISVNETGASGWYLGLMVLIINK